MGGDETSFVPLRLTVGTSSDDGNNNHTAGEWLNVTDGQYSPRPLTMGMSTDAIVDAPAVGDIEPAPGTTVFVGMQIYAPATGTYEVVLAVDEQGCTASCTEIGCCQHDPPSTWSEAIAANAMDAIPEFRLRLNILTGDMSVLHTEVKVREDLLESGVATYTPVQNLELQLQAKDSAGNVRTQRGDAFQMRLCMQEGELACGSYVTPNNTANQKTYSPDEASLWCGAAACPGPQVNGEPAACEPGESRAKMIIEDEMRNESDNRRRYVCADAAGCPLCQQYDPAETGRTGKWTVIGGVNVQETLQGVGGAEQPGVFAAEPGDIPGAYRISTAGTNYLQGIMSLPGGATEERRLYGRYVVRIEGIDETASSEDDYANRIGGSVWVEAEQTRWTPEHDGLWAEVRRVECSSASGELVGSELALDVDTGAQVCTCMPGYERDEYDALEINGLLEPGQVVCKPCAEGMYKETTSNTEMCEACPEGTESKQETCDRGGCVSLMSCECMDGYYDFRTTYIACRERNDGGYQVEDDTKMMDSLAALHSNGDRCTELPECAVASTTIPTNDCLDTAPFATWQHAGIAPKEGYYAPATTPGSLHSVYWQNWVVDGQGTADPEDYAIPNGQHPSCPNGRCYYDCHGEECHHRVIEVWRCPDGLRCKGGVDWSHWPDGIARTLALHGATALTNCTDLDEADNETRSQIAQQSPDGSTSSYVQFDYQPGYYWDGENSDLQTLASAHAGYYLDTNTLGDPDEEHFKECVPFDSCAGQCEGVISDQTKYAECAPGVNGENCARGYRGQANPFCKLCDKYDPSKVCTDETPNGAYRVEGRCIPCPCTWFTFWWICLFALLFVLCCMLILDQFLRKVDHLSSLFAPLMILVTFGQGIALFAELDVPWPKMLRDLLEWLSVFNINLELGRPECSGTFGAQERVMSTLGLPLALAIVVGSYAAIKKELASRQELEQFKAEHGGKTPAQVIERQIVTIATSSFVFMSSFFVKNILTAWNCTAPGADGNAKTFLRVEPEIECSMDDERYMPIFLLCFIGFISYTATFCIFVGAIRERKHLFEFLGNKFEVSELLACVVVYRFSSLTSNLCPHRTGATTGSWCW